MMLLTTSELQKLPILTDEGVSLKYKTVLVDQNGFSIQSLVATGRGLNQFRGDYVIPCSAVRILIPDEGFYLTLDSHELELYRDKGGSARRPDHTMPMAFEAEPQIATQDFQLGNDPDRTEETYPISELFECHIECLDGRLGKIEDIFFHPGMFSVHYCVVQAGNRFSKRRFLVAPQWFEKLSWSQHTVYINVHKDSITSGPLYEPRAGLDRNFERLLMDHHSKLPHGHREIPGKDNSTSSEPWPV